MSTHTGQIIYAVIAVLVIVGIQLAIRRNVQKRQREGTAGLWSKPIDQAFRDLFKRGRNRP